MTTPESLANSVNRLCRVTHSLQFAHGLNPAQWDALRYIARANKYSTTPGNLAEYLGTTKGTVSQTLIALETKGLVKRIRCEADRRKVRLGLTAEGRAMLLNDPIRRIAMASARLPESAQQTVQAVLTAMVEQLCARRDGPQFGVCGDCSHLDRSCGPGSCAGACRCGLMGEALRADEMEQICVNFEAGEN
jgi:DNA-binding MarR family transcriptional regulator